MTTLKIAILLNGFTSPNTPSVKHSFISAITTASSSIPSLSPPTITFYDPIIAQIYPDPNVYDLIILSGGSADPMGSYPWVLKVQEFLRKTAAEYPKQKIVGICWGHQTTTISFGGSVTSMNAPEVGVHTITLTPAGQKMFPFAQDGKLMLHEFHRREISVVAKGFVALAEGNQAFVNEANTILTFQGHPELNAGLARMFVESALSYMGLDDEGKKIYMGKAGMGHDGGRIWERVLRWVGE